MDDTKTIIDPTSQDSLEDQVIPEEVAEETVNDQTQDFLNLESLVKTYVEKIDKLQKEIHEKTEMVNDAFEGDAVYREHSEKVKEAARIKTATKQQIMKQPAVAALVEKIKDLKFEVKESQVLLSDYLDQYQKSTGATSIEVGDGEIMEIVSVTKLVKRSK